MERGRSSKSRKEIAKEYRSSNVNSLFIAEEALKRREQSYNERGRDGLWTCDMPGCEVKFDRLKKRNTIGGEFIRKNDYLNVGPLGVRRAFSINLI